MAQRSGWMNIFQTTDIRIQKLCTQYSSEYFRRELKVTVVLCQAVHV